jgi:hypothetical protein
MNHLNDDLLNKYIDEDAEVSEINLINEHISSCNECMTRLNSLKAIHFQLMRMESSSPSEDFTAKLMKRLERSVRRKKEQTYFFSVIFSVLLVLVLIIAGCAVSISSVKLAGYADIGNYLSNLNSHYDVILTWLKKVSQARSLTLIGSVLSLGILISAYFFYDTHKAIKNLLK